jgi:hypothetical protein
MLRRLTILAGVPFMALSAATAIWVNGGTAASLAPALVGVTMALAIFAINFSFVAFQLAPYRQLLRGPSPTHLLAALGLVIIALLPLIGSLCSTETTGRLAAAVTPLLAYGTIFLVVLGLREAEPDRVLATKASDTALDRFARQFELAAREQIKALQQLDFEADLPTDDRFPPPTHEIFHRVPPPPLKDDPFEICVRTVEASIKADDAAVFTPSVERLLYLLERLRSYSYKDSDGINGWEVAAAGTTHGVAALNRVAELLGSSEASGVLVSRFTDIVARHVRQAGFDGQATSERVISLFMTGVAISKRKIERDSDGAGVIGLLLAARKVCDQTLRSLDREQDQFGDHSLAAYPAGVRAIGEAAIEQGDSDLLFRCMETLSWIGCAAVRFGGRETGLRAAGGLVQLGRMARYARLECPWPRCTLTPFQHVRERLAWMVTWIPKADNPHQWLEPLSTAFSRLDGYEKKLRLNEETDPLDVEFVPNEERKPHQESFFAEGGTRTLDYSDEGMLKDQVLR